MARKTIEGDVSDFLATYPASITRLSEQARTLVMQCLGGSDEVLHLGWKSISYRVNGRTVCALLPHGRWVNVQFPQGVDLPDPQKLLEGTGKRMRHVKVRSREDLSADLAELIRQARVESTT